MQAPATSTTGQSIQFQMAAEQSIHGGPRPRHQERQQGSLLKWKPICKRQIDFLNTAQQFAPVVQQFAPMVQNLPAMWRLYKGFQSLPSAGGAAATGQRAANCSSAATANATASGRYLSQESSSRPTDNFESYYPTPL